MNTSINIMRRFFFGRGEGGSRTPSLSYIQLSNSKNKASDHTKLSHWNLFPKNIFQIMKITLIFHEYMGSFYFGRGNSTPYYLCAYDCCVPANMSASSIKWVVRRINLFFFFSFRTFHRCRLEYGSIPAVGSSR